MPRPRTYYDGFQLAVLTRATLPAASRLSDRALAFATEAFGPGSQHVQAAAGALMSSAGWKHPQARSPAAVGPKSGSIAAVFGGAINPALL